jgi:DmsE family decaheme c-type cytochrome
MGRMKRTVRPPAVMIGAVLVWLGAVLGVGAAPPSVAELSPAAAAQTPAAPAQTEAPTELAAPSAAAGAEYVGEAVCVTCHEDETKTYSTTKHARALNPRTPGAKQTCESCHGPGSRHVEADGDGFIDNPRTMKPRDASATCTTCHNRTEHSQWAGGKHDARNISCVTCHSQHAPKSEHAQLKEATQLETCAQCHKPQVAKLHRAAHMPVREGKMECSTCHNPHGSDNVKMLREGNSISESCTSCHTEKRGPFLWEHAPNRESCITCHDPHGSNNERMLVAKAPMLCQRCHTHSRHPATIYDNTQLLNRSNRIAGRACLNCHSQIHGSNHPTSGKAFIR